MIYSQLSNDFNASAAGAFKEGKLLYLEASQSWFGKNQVFWVDASSIFGKRYGYCELSFESQLKEFFVSQIGIEEKPPPEILVDFLEEVNEHFQQTQSVEAKVIISRLFAELSSYAVAQNLDVSLLQKVNKKVLVHSGQIWINDGDIFYNDNDALFKLYKDEPAIGFIDLLKEYLPKATFLLQRLGIRFLSKEVKAIGLNLNLAIINDKLTNKVRKYAGVLEDLMYTQYNLKYEVLKRNGVFEKLKDFKVYEIPELQLEYRLNDIVKTGLSSSYLDEQSIYLNRNSENLLYSLAIELANFLDQPLLLEFLIIM